jgi:hypothetical protein
VTGRDATAPARFHDNHDQFSGEREFFATVRNRRGLDSAFCQIA